MQYYLERAIAPSTRRTYDTAIANWRAYCEDRRWDPDGAVTNLHAEEWLASLADRGRLKASTIRIYKAALSTWHEENSTGPNPLQSGRISRLVAGIEASAAEREARARLARPKSAGVTMDMIRRLSSHLSRGTAREMMMLGAAALATAAALRPSELLGSTGEARALTVDQLRFFDAQGTPILSFSTGAPAPAHCTITLRISKTNQRRRPEHIHVSAAVAVRAAWAWRLARHPDSQNGRYGSELFRLPSARPLRTSALVGFTRLALHKLGWPNLHLTGKCFRIGGTSTLAASGASDDAMRRLGRWRTNVWSTTYADEEAHKTRDLNARKEM